MKNQRIHERIPMSMSICCRTYVDHKGEDRPFEEPVSFDMVNLSVGGVLVKSKDYVEPEKILHYTLYLEDIAYVILSRIRWVDEIDEGYLYGLEFFVTPNMFYRHLRNFVKKTRPLQLRFT